MTNGLTKLARPVFTPGRPLQNAQAPIAERWYLTPSPPGYFYVFAEGEWRLRLLPSSSQTTPGQAARSYSIPVSGGSGSGYSYPQGATLTFRYASAYGATPTVAISRTSSGAGGVSPPAPPAGMVLVRIDVYVPGTAPGPVEDIPSTELAPLPAGAAPIWLFGMPNQSNGYPANAPPRVLGDFQVPQVDGSVFYVRRFYRRLPNGAYVPDGGDPDPPYITTLSTGLQPVLLSNYPGAPYLPAIPSKTEYEKWLDWNAGANSIAELSGDVYTEFLGPEATGAYVGFFEGGQRPSDDFSALVAAFRFAQTPTGRKWSILDAGRAVTITTSSYALSDKFTIKRANGRMVFFVNEVEVYRSRRHSAAALRVGTTLYASGDKVL